MQIFEVGKPYPHYTRGKEEGFLPVRNNGWLDIVIAFSNPSAEEIKAASAKSTLIYGVTIEKNIPFLVIGTPQFNGEVVINPFLLDKQELIRWLNQEANICNIILIDSSTTIIKSLRLVGMDLRPIKKFKEAVNAAYEHFEDNIDFQQNQNAVQIRYNTNQLFNRIRKYRIS